MDSGLLFPLLRSDDVDDVDDDDNVDVVGVVDSC